MITTVVGNAHVFLVMHDLETNKDFGVHVEISDPSLFINNTGTKLPPVTLQGDFVKQELADLDFCKSGVKVGLPDESV